MRIRLSGTISVSKKKKGCLEGFGLRIRNQERTDDKIEETKTASVSQDLRLNTET